MTGSESRSWQRRERNSVRLLRYPVRRVVVDEGAERAGVHTSILGAGALLFLVGALVLVEVSALRQIAVRAALPTNLAPMDLAIRQIATRFVLLLSTSAVLASAALIALESGGWLFNNAAILNPGQSFGTLAGAVVAVVGSLAAIGSLASVTAAVAATVKHARSSSRRAALPVAVSA